MPPPTEPVQQPPSSVPARPPAGAMPMIPVSALPHFLGPQTPPGCVLGHDFQRLEPNKEGYFKLLPGQDAKGGRKDETKRWSKLYCTRCGIGLEIIVHDYSPIQNQQPQPNPVPLPPRPDPRPTPELVTIAKTKEEPPNEPGPSTDPS